MNNTENYFDHSVSHIPLAFSVCICEWSMISSVPALLQCVSRAFEPLKFTHHNERWRTLDLERVHFYVWGCCDVQGLTEQTLIWGFLWAIENSRIAKLYFHSNWEFERLSKCRGMKGKSEKKKELKELTCEFSSISPFRKILCRREKYIFKESLDWLGMKKENIIQSCCKIC